MSRRAKTFFSQAEAFREAAREMQERSPVVEMFLLAQAAHMGRFALREIGQHSDNMKRMGRELRQMQLQMDQHPELVPGPKVMTVRRFLLDQFLATVEGQVGPTRPDAGHEPA